MLNGNFGVQYTRGVQEGEDSRYYKTVVTLKHWDAYSECGRNTFFCQCYY